MKTIHVCMFDELAGHAPEPVKIVIDEAIPDHDTLEDAAKFHSEQARQIEDALYNALPQGTYDRLAHLLAARKVSLYRGMTE